MPEQSGMARHHLDMVKGWPRPPRRRVGEQGARSQERYSTAAMEMFSWS